VTEKVGVVAIQGDFEKHLEALRRCGVKPENLVEVRTPEDLALVSRIILPGGESTTVGMLMERFGLGEALRNRAKSGMPVWGTCMGMILMAREIQGRPHQFSLGLLDVQIQRNAFGAQVHSFEEELEVKGLEEPITAVFIRAPVVTLLGAGVESLAVHEGKIVAVRQGALLGTSFHPELTDDLQMHRLFLGIPTSSKGRAK
jgi:5'-phosphate synthase pdxT subunit